MKWVYYALGILILGPILFFGSIYAASEIGGEVVVLHRKSADGSIDRVRVWIVEDEQRTWIEHGAPDSAWITSLTDDPVITLERDGQPTSYQAYADPGAHAQYHALRREKYGFADRYIELVSGSADTCEGVPVQIRLTKPAS